MWYVVDAESPLLVSDTTAWCVRITIFVEFVKSMLRKVVCSSTLIQDLNDPNVVEFWNTTDSISPRLARVNLALTDLLTASLTGDKVFVNYNYSIT